MTLKTALSQIAKILKKYEAGGHLDFKFDPKKPIVRLHEGTYRAKEILAALEPLMTTRITMGETVKKFEEACCRYFRHPECVMSNSGSSANLLAVAALANPATPDGLRPGDEVIVPALSWSTTVWPVIQMGLVPVIADCDPKTLNLGPREIQAAMSPKTRGIVLVHVYGNPAAMNDIMPIVREKNLILVEDSCESMGAFYEGKPVGSWGRAATFSFYFSHHVTTLEGGITLTPDADLADLMRILRAHGWARETKRRKDFEAKHPEVNPRFLFVNIGYNLRPTEVQAAMGLVQLPKLDPFVNIRRANATYWRKRFAPFGDVLQLQEDTPKGRGSFFGFPMSVKPRASFTKDELCAFLGTRGIESRPIIAGNMARQPALKMYPHRIAGNGVLPNADHVMKNGFTWGNHQGVDAKARAHVADAVEEFLAGKGIRA